MITYENSINKIRVEAYTLYEFIQETGEVQATGATLCLDNAFFCQNMGGNYIAYFDTSTTCEDNNDDALAMAITPPLIGESIPFTKEQNEALAHLDSTPSDVNTAATPPVVADGIPFTPEQDAALAQATAVTPEQVENVNRRRGRPPRN